MNVKDLFAKAENGTLTYDQFKALAEENKVKFADLSEGNYVDKNKYSTEVTSLQDQVKTLNESITQRDTDLAELKTKLESAGADATKLADLSSQFTDLQAKYDKDVADYQAKLTKQKYDFAVNRLADAEKFTSTAAKNFFIKTLSDANLNMEGDNIAGAADFLTKYKADNADSFVVEDKKEPEPQSGNKLPQFATSTSPQKTEPTESMFGFNFRGVR